MKFTSQQRWTKSGVWTSRRRTLHAFCGCGVQKVSLTAEVEVIFFLLFFAHLKLMVASIFLANFHEGLAFLTKHLAFLRSKVCFCISCCSMYAKSNTFWTFKLKHLGLLVWSPYSLLVIQNSYWTCGFAICSTFQ